MNFFGKKNESLKANKFGPLFFPNVSTLVELNIVEYSNLIFFFNRTFFFLKSGLNENGEKICETFCDGTKNRPTTSDGNPIEPD